MKLKSKKKVFEKQNLENRLQDKAKKWSSGKFCVKFREAKIVSPFAIYVCRHFLYPWLYVCILRFSGVLSPSTSLYNMIHSYTVFSSTFSTKDCKNPRPQFQFVKWLRSSQKTGGGLTHGGVCDLCFNPSFFKISLEIISCVKFLRFIT